jgi:hypothetical protein
MNTTSASPLNEDFSVNNNVTTVATPPNNATVALDGLFSNDTTNNATAVFPPDANKLSKMDPVTNAILSLGWLFLLLYCCTRHQVPAEELRRAREIREQAARSYQERPTQEQQEKQQENESTQDRQLRVDASLRTKVRRL